MFVAGGFGAESLRLDSIEMFNEETKEWLLIGIKLYVPIEASIFIPKGNTIFYFGGREAIKGDCGTVYKFD